MLLKPMLLADSYVLYFRWTFLLLMPATRKFLSERKLCGVLETVSTNVNRLLDNYAVHIAV